MGIFATLVRKGAHAEVTANAEPDANVLSFRCPHASRPSVNASQPGTTRAPRAQWWDVRPPGTVPTWVRHWTG